jgi:inosine/xanthosine triphosphatase
MLNIVVASTNPVKLQAALAGLRRMFPAETFAARGLAVPSGVDPQPMSDAETLQGALNRSAGAWSAAPEADYWVGIEGGCQASQAELAVFAWAVVRSRDRLGKGRTGEFFLPPAVADLVRSGTELGEADDLVFGRTNSKQANFIPRSLGEGARITARNNNIPGMSQRHTGRSLRPWRFKAVLAQVSHYA